MTLAFLCDAYDEQVVGQDKKGNDDVRVVHALPPGAGALQGRRAATEQEAGAQGRRRSTHELSKYFMVDYDDAGSIGKRYRREDEIGTPYCITVDFETVGDENTPGRQLPSPSATATPWSRCACPSASSRAGSRSASRSDRSADLIGCPPPRRITARRGGCVFC